MAMTLRLRLAIVLVAWIGLPGVAGAQATPPVPPAPPVPPVAPAPVTPRPIYRLNELQRALDEPSRAIELLRLELQQTVAAQTARAMAEDAIHLARQELDHVRLTWPTDLPGSQYTAGKDLLGRGQYEQAIAQFDRVIARKESNVDGALYWKAYAQYRLGRTDDALATIATLRRDHAGSRYLADAKPLEADVRKRAGQPVNPADLDDDEIKLLAISGIKDADPDRAIPLLEGVLGAANSLRVKRQALFVLATMTQPRAYQILLGYAKGAGNPDLQIEAIRYVAASRNRQAASADLMQIYQATQDTNVKLAIISALRTIGDQTSLTHIASSSTAPMVVRSSALNGLTGILSPQDLWTLYEKEPNKDLRLQMISAFASMQAVDQLNRAIRTEKDADVRRRAVGALGGMKPDRTGQMLVDLYGAEADVETRRTIIQALAAQTNAEALVAIARKETTLALKTAIVRRLSDLAPKSKVAADYLMEIIR